MQKSIQTSDNSATGVSIVSLSVRHQERSMKAEIQHLGGKHV